jgi:hypothetical protein
MTTHEAPSPYHVEFSSQYSATYAGWKLFDGVSNSYWCTTAGIKTGWISIYLGPRNFKRLYGYSIKYYGDQTSSGPKDWTLEGSTDGINWTVLDIRSNKTGWSNGLTRFYDCNFPVGSFNYFRLNVSLNNGGSYVQVGEIYLYEAASETHGTTTTSTTTTTTAP